MSGEDPGCQSQEVGVEDWGRAAGVMREEVEVEEGPVRNYESGTESTPGRLPSHSQLITTDKAHEAIRKGACQSSIVSSALNLPAFTQPLTLSCGWEPGKSQRHHESSKSTCGTGCD
ncbi:hypothetical protein PAMP_023041 [Pampus punctatissimus]